MHFRY